MIDPVLFRASPGTRVRLQVFLIMHRLSDCQAV
jgi:hypothetical protein